MNSAILRPVMPELDSIRGLAIAMVVIYHAFFWGTDLSAFGGLSKLFITATWIGRMGVNLFFVLSGFLITGLLLDSAQRPDYYRRFYYRRALRILPAYYAILLLLTALRQASFKFIALSAIYLANVTPLFGVAMSYPVLWSLAVEEHFYLFWPIAARNLNIRKLFYLSAAIILLTPAARTASFLLASRTSHVSFTFNGYTWNSLDGLACGALLAIAIRSFGWSHPQLLRFAGICALAASLIWFAGLPFGILSRQGSLVGAALQVVPWNIGFTGLLALSLVLGTGPWRQIVLLPPLRYLGYISYGLYLIHALVFEAYDALLEHAQPGRFSALFFRFVICSTAAVLLAHLSRKYFEAFFLRLKDSGPSPRPAVAPPAYRGQSSA